MSQTGNYNLILFRPSGSTGTKSCALTLDRPWKLSAGLKPDINQATCPAPEFQNIADVNQPGTIEMYFTSGSTSPDVTIADVKIVDIEPMTLGPYLPAGANTPVDGYAEYRLSFADWRESFQPPRGGRLYYGPINASPAGQPTSTSSTTSTTSTSPELTMLQLVTLCLQNMGVNTPSGAWSSGNWGDLPSTLNQTAAPRNLKWFGNHAAGELDKLLTLAGHVFCPHLDGTFSVEQISASIVVAWGTPPGAGTYTALPTGTAAKIDQRGRYVAITSAPTRAINTETLSGPESGNFDFVVWTSGSSGTGWIEIGKFYGSSTTAGQVFHAWTSGGASGLQQLSKQGSLPSGLPSDALDPAVASQIFSFVRISDQQLGNRELSPILACRFEADGSEQPIQILATGAAIYSGGAWNNSPIALTYTATDRLHDHVLKLSSPAFAVDSSGNFQELAAGAMTIRFSIEQFQPNPAAQDAPTGAQPQYVPYYYTAGFSAGAQGGASQLEEDDVADLLNGTTKGAVILDRPEMLLLIVDGKVINQSQLDAVSAQIAGAYLKSGGPHTVQAVIGFAEIEPSGAVSSVEWDQKAVKTTAQCVDFYTAAASVGMHNVRKTEGGTGSGQAASEAHPHEAKTQSGRDSLGASGNSPRTLPLMPATVPPSGGGTVWVWSTGPIAGKQGAYNGMQLTNPQALYVDPGTGSVRIDFNAQVAQANGSTQAAGTPCVIIDPAENDVYQSNLPTQCLLLAVPMPSVSVALGLDPALPTFWAVWDPSAVRNVSYDAVGHNLNDSTFPSPTTPQQKLVVHFVDCATGT